MFIVFAYHVSAVIAAALVFIVFGFLVNAVMMYLCSLCLFIV